MKRTIERDGIMAFINEEFEAEKYHPKHETAWERWTELLELRWPKAAIGREFNRTREQIRAWIKAMIKEGIWNEEKYGPALNDPNSETS